MSGVRKAFRMSRSRRSRGGVHPPAPADLAGSRAHTPRARRPHVLNLPGSHDQSSVRLRGVRQRGAVERRCRDGCLPALVGAHVRSHAGESRSQSGQCRIRGSVSYRAVIISGIRDRVGIRWKLGTGRKLATIKIEVIVQTVADALAATDGRSRPSRGGSRDA